MVPILMRRPRHDDARHREHSRRRQGVEPRWIYARTLYEDPGATLDDLREAVKTLEDSEWIARRVFGGEHPLTTGLTETLGESRDALRARETPPGS